MLRHRKCVRLEISINTYLEVERKETTQDKYDNHLQDIIINKLQLVVTKNTQTVGVNEKND